MQTVQLNVNGTRKVARDVRPHTTLLNYLRSEGLTGCKEGCAEGECGACAVLLARPTDDGGTRLESVNACLVLMGTLEGQEVVTAEGIGQPGALHPIQHEMAVRGGSQCGYCTPGFVVSMAAEYYRPERGEGDPQGVHQGTGPNGFDIHSLSGNLCRCTGYRPIQDAAYALGSPAEGDVLAERRAQPAPAPQPTHLTTPEGDFHRPATLSEALELLEANPAAKLLSGGTDWGVEVNIRHARAAVTIALDGLPELRGLTWTDEHLEIGAGLPLTEIERRLGDQVPLLAEWFPQFASRLIRNSATLGGNIGTASPIGDSPPVLLALDAGVILVGKNGEREVKVSGFFTGYRKTVMAAGELIKAVRIPLPLAPTTGFFKIAKRRFDDISSVAVGIALELDGETVKRIHIGLGGVAATPIRGSKAEQALTGQTWNEKNVRAAAKLLGSEGTPLDDHRASAAYRAAMLEQTLLKFYFEKSGKGVLV
ncbi:2Fe-2S iron-sulfur cluster binding domain-containing protein [Deinococcus detaillensis]|uniref:2Fe-2S iron-sulfur cluster binding domain-containing protein n=1 Tax=Deinococcus detaillensis TaxID=2592048 RepID=A0A553V4W1_9DEIO|nr:FAD binding domain-containing protein [Deinococcus detaillensis]TSA87424.1 2Fe-2S iron-sulfur cluster binding domain-containing protein [Deinococcus detaillensis]